MTDTEGGPYLQLTLADAENIEAVFGSDYADYFIGNGLDNFLSGNSGDDTLEGGGGDDTLLGGVGGDIYLFSGSDDLGSDVIDDVAEADDGFDALFFFSDFSDSSHGGLSLDLADGSVQTVVSGLLSLTFEQTNLSTIVLGTRFDDDVQGTLASNLLFGGPGNDTLAGGGGDDYYGFAGVGAMPGCEDADSLGADEIIENADEGADGLVFFNGGDESPEAYPAGATIDLTDSMSQVVTGPLSTGQPDFLTLTLTNAAEIEDILGTDFADHFIGNDAANLLAGNGGDDTLEGGGGHDTLSGGTGQDFFVFAGTSDLGTDTIDDIVDDDPENSDAVFNFGGFSDATHGGVTLNLGDASSQPQSVLSGLLQLRLLQDDIDGGVIGTSFDDDLTGNDANNAFAGGPGDDTLAGGGGDDAYIFSGLEQGLWATGDNLGSDTIEEEQDGGGDALMFWSSDFGDEFISAYPNGAHVDLTRDDQQLVTDTEGGPYLQLTLADAENIEAVFGSDYADYFIGNGLDNFLSGNSGDDSILGGDGNDTLAGERDDDTLKGEGGDDTLSGLTGDDSLEGGAGSDSLDGGSGVDFYVFSGNQDLGADRILDDFEDGMPRPDAVLWFNEFSDGSPSHGGLNLDLGLSTNQTVVDGLLDLIVEVPEVRWAVIGTAFDDDIRGNDYLDFLAGGPGDDRLEGRGGDDQYLYTGTSLAGWSSATDLGADELVEAENGGIDRLSFWTTEDGAELPNYPDAARVDLNLSVQQTVTVAQPGAIVDFLRVTLNSPEQFEGLQGSEFSDYLIGNGEANILLGNIGMDTLVGNSGDDHLQGSDGDDTLEGGAGNDLLEGGIGQDFYVFTGTNALGTDTIDDVNYDDPENSDAVFSFGGFSDETHGGVTLNLGDASSEPQSVVSGLLQLQLLQGFLDAAVIGTSFDDDITGNGGKNAFVGGPGDDTLAGGGGDDAYIYSSLEQGPWATGDNLGSDTIEEGQNGGGDVLMFWSSDFGDEFISAYPAGANVDLTRDDQQMVTSNENVPFLQLTITSPENIEGVLGSDYADSLVGNSQGNMLRGFGGDDSLAGNSGDDLLFGGAGDDTLEGGAGDDGVFGEEGSDTYVFARADANDVLDTDYLAEAESAGSDIDTLDLSGFRVNNEDVDEHGNGVTLDLSEVGYGSGQLTLLHYDPATLDNDPPTFVSLAIGFEHVIGTINNDLIAAGDNAAWIEGLAGNDTLTGGGGDDALEGGDGNDSLDGGTGSDILDGGDGNDFLGGGADSQAVNLLLGGAGQDTIYGSGGQDLAISNDVTWTGSERTLALKKIFDEWAATTRTPAQRRDNILGVSSGGANDPYFLDTSTVVSDSLFEEFSSGGNDDWFVHGLDDEFIGGLDSGDFEDLF